MSEAEKIAAGLSERQAEALLHPNAGGCAYRWAAIGTLNALNKRKLVRRIGGIGEMFSPTTVIRWPLTELGLAVRAALEHQSREAM